MVIGIILSLQILLLALGILIACKSKDAHNNIIILPLWIKVSLIMSLVLSSFLIFRNGKDVLRIYSSIVFIGMIFSAIGDLIRAGIVKSRKSLLSGGVMFICAHIMYISAYATASGRTGYSIMSSGFYLGIIFYQILFWLAWLMYMRKKKFKNSVKMLLGFYGVFLSIMASMAASLFWNLGGLWIIAALGGFCFFISDLFIGIVDFGGAPIKYRHILVWLFYILGQIGIIYAPWFIGFIT